MTAKLMTYSGMTADIAKAMVAGTGTLYPLFAPIVGALGAFLTGSGQNSNVLFGPTPNCRSSRLKSYKLRRPLVSGWQQLTPVQLVSAKCCPLNPSRFLLVP